MPIQRSTSSNLPPPHSLFTVAGQQAPADALAPSALHPEMRGDARQRQIELDRARYRQKAYNKKLVQRTISRENAARAYTAKSLARARRFAETTENSVRSRQIGQHIVSTGELPQPVGGDGRPVSTHEIVNQYLGLREALDYLERPAADHDDVFYKARLLPVGERSLSAHELSETLSKARDEAELAALLTNVLGMERDEKKLFAELKDIRGSQKELMDYLSRALNLDHPGPKMFAGSVDELYQSLLTADADQANSGAMGELLQKPPYRLRGSRQELSAKARRHLGSAQQLAAFVNRELRGDDDAHAARIMLRDQVRDALGELEAEWGDVIETNLDAEPVAARSSLPREFVRSYSDMLYESTSFADAALQMLEKFGVEELPETVDLMSSALESMKRRLAAMKKEMGEEMRDLHPDTIKLHATITALHYMHILTTLIEATETYVRDTNQAAAAAGIAAGGLDAKEFLKGLIGIVASSASWLQPNQFENMLKKMGVPENMDVRPLHKILDMLRTLPDKAYVDNHARNTAIEGARGAIDKAVEREEARAEAEELAAGNTDTPATAPLPAAAGD